MSDSDVQIVSFKPRLWKPPLQEDLDLSAKIDTLRERIAGIAKRFDRIKLASSLAVEDMLVADILLSEAPQAEIFTLQTGMLNKETLELIGQVEDHWSIKVAQYTPDPDDVEEYVSKNGKFAFYESVDMRRECCRIRKVVPLGRALSDADTWLTGQRREQSVTRTELQFEEADQAHGIPKFNPILDWTEAEVWNYIYQHKLPINKLYFEGYPSIGCEPCTRPVKEGEDLRAGRWWWEQQDTKECGLHA